jgi:hypothetical protein
VPALTWAGIRNFQILRAQSEMHAKMNAIVVLLLPLMLLCDCSYDAYVHSANPTIPACRDVGFDGSTIAASAIDGTSLRIYRKSLTYPTSGLSEKKIISSVSRMGSVSVNSDTVAALQYSVCTSSPCNDLSLHVYEQDFGGFDQWGGRVLPENVACTFPVSYSETSQPAAPTQNFQLLSLDMWGDSIVAGNPYPRFDGTCTDALRTANPSTMWQGQIILWSRNSPNFDFESDSEPPTYFYAGPQFAPAPSDRTFFGQCVATNGEFVFAVKPACTVNPCMGSNDFNVYVYRLRNGIWTPGAGGRPSSFTEQIMAGNQDSYEPRVSTEVRDMACTAEATTDFLVVAFERDNDPLYIGGVYVYERNLFGRSGKSQYDLSGGSPSRSEWVFRQKLTYPFSGISYARFGSDISIFGDTIVVSARQTAGGVLSSNSANTGSVFTFRKNSCPNVIVLSRSGSTFTANYLWPSLNVGDPVVLGGNLWGGVEGDTVYFVATKTTNPFTFSLALSDSLPMGTAASFVPYGANNAGTPCSATVPADLTGDCMFMKPYDTCQNNWGLQRQYIHNVGNERAGRGVAYMGGTTIGTLYAGKMLILQDAGTDRMVSRLSILKQSFFQPIVTGTYSGPPRGGEKFGEIMAYLDNGRRVLVGCPLCFASASGKNKGGVMYVYTRINSFRKWLLESTVMVPAAASPRHNEKFGMSIATDLGSQTVAVGTAMGRVHLFLFKSADASWTYQGALQATTTITGRTVATDDGASVFIATSTDGMSEKSKIRFFPSSWGSMYGGLSARTSYYVRKVISSTTFTVATNRVHNSAGAAYVMPATTQSVDMNVAVAITARGGANDNIFTCTNTKGLILRGAVTFTASPTPLTSGFSATKLFGGVIAKKTYFIFSIDSDTTFSISLTLNGGQMDLSGAKSGTMYMRADACCMSVSIAGNAEFSSSIAVEKSLVAVGAPSGRAFYGTSPEVDSPSCGLVFIFLTPSTFFNRDMKQMNRVGGIVATLKPPKRVMTGFSTNSANFPSFPSFPATIPESVHPTYSRVGASIALRNITLFISSSHVDDQWQNKYAGVVFVFRPQKSSTIIPDFQSYYNYNSWDLVATLVAPDSFPGMMFGWSMSLSIDGRFLVVGAPTDSTASANHYYAVSSGSAYVLEQNSQGNWTFVSKLSSASPQAGARFGHSVAAGYSSKSNFSSIYVGSPLFDCSSKRKSQLFDFEMIPDCGIVEMYEPVADYQFLVVLLNPTSTASTGGSADFWEIDSGGLGLYQRTFNPIKDRGQDSIWATGRRNYEIHDVRMLHFRSRA